MTAEEFLTAKAVRTTTSQVFDLVSEGEGSFYLHMGQLESCADKVIEVIRENYPDLNIPYHSRWGHFKVGGHDRVKSWLDQAQISDPMERARCFYDLVTTSVLLDAGAGPEWAYLENETNERYGRSEGLAVASYYLFQQGGFSSQKDQPFLADAKGLQSVTPMTIKEAFQVSERNPLIGVEGRALLMSSLGKAIENNSEYFIGGRIGGLVDYFDQTYGKSFSADKILYVVLRALSSIWPGRLEMDGMRLGDVWSHTKLGKGAQGYVAFHKLSQWLSYSLIEPLEWAGFKITDLDELTGLAEYRNGGLFLDSGVIELRHLGDLAKQHPPQSDLIIEWRALTVQLLDRIAPIIREKLGLEDFPLAKVLEGGTWWTGRKLASEKRSDSSPPLNIKSDGTVF